MKLFTFFSAIVFVLCSCTQSVKLDDTLVYGDYFGQNPPFDSAVVFAPDIVSTPYHEHSFPAISPDGNLILWNTNFMDNYAYEFPVKILAIQKRNNIWGKVDYFEPTSMYESSGAIFSPDGKKILFTVREQIKETGIDLNIYYFEKTHEGWTNSLPINGSVNTEKIEGQVSLTSSETIYYLGHLEGVKNNYGIFRSRLVNGQYQNPEALPAIINSKNLDWTPFIAPDESYLLFSSFREGGYGAGDIWISFRDSSDNWSEPQNLGPQINKNNNERFPYVSPDGKYLFYLTDKVDNNLLAKKKLSFSEAKYYFSKTGNGQCDIYWVSSKIISDLKQNVR